MAKLILALAGFATVLAGPSVLPYSIEKYNALPHFLDLPPETPEEALSVQPLGKVLQKYGLEDQVGIFLSHRHFNLFPGEKLVAKLSKDSVHIEPEQNKSDLWPYFYQISEDALGAIQLQPMEFIHQPSEAFKAKHAALVSAEFVQDYVSAWANNTLLQKFNGLFVLHREDVVGNRTLETSAGGRALQVQGENTVNTQSAHDHDMDLRTVMYTFAGYVEAGCGHDSCRHGHVR